MSVKLLSYHHLEVFSLKKAAHARLSLHLSKCDIIGNHMSRLIYRCQKILYCMLHIISLCAQISQNVKYWYEKCDILVPIFHAL